MKKIILTFVLFSGFAFSVSWATDPTVNSCETRGRDVNLCYKMKNIKSMLNLLEGQQSLMQLNYPYMETISDNMKQVIDRITVGMNEHSHLAPLLDVRKQVAQVTSLARNKDVEAFKAINSIKNKCQSCHADQNPTSGIKWDQTSGQSWSMINKKCETDGRNPFICRLMHGVSTQVAFIESVEPSQVREFSAAEAAGNEALRLINVLSNLQSPSTPNHDWKHFNEIKPMFSKMVKLAKEKDERAYDIAPAVVQSCTQCHGYH